MSKTLDSFTAANSNLDITLSSKGLGPDKVEQIIEQHTQLLTPKEVKTDKPYILGLIGLYGSGKTTVADKIEKVLPFTKFGTDPLRRIMEEGQVDSKLIDDNRVIAYIGLQILERIMQKRLNVIVDADLRDKPYRQLIESMAHELGYEVILLNVTVPEQELVRRIRKRQEREPSKFIRKNMQRHYTERKHIHNKYPLPDNVFMEIVNDQDLDTQMDELKRRLLVKFDIG